MKSMIELLQQLIRIESVSGNEAEIADFLEEYLSDLFPGSVSRLDNNLIVEAGSGAQGETILFCSHIDTVPPVSGWTKDPFGAEADGDRIYGLGANDALASVVSMIAAVKSCAENIKGKILLVLACEEEKGGNGFRAIEQKLPRYDFAVFGEPTDLNIAYCMRGFMKLKMISRGQAAHAARPEEGENAIFLLARHLDLLKSLPLSDSSPWGGATVQPTIVQGGTAGNQLPDYVETTLDVRTTPQNPNERILELLSEAGIEYEVIWNRRKPSSCSPDSKYIKALQSANDGVELVPFGGTCDMAFASSPAVVLGPGKGNRSHAADEYITREELEDGESVYQKSIEALFSLEK
jgi:acetylornithine deacetylase